MTPSLHARRRPFVPVRTAGGGSQRSRGRAAALAASLSLALAGCGTLAGVHDAPAEVTEGASISQAAGAEVTTRVLSEAAVVLDPQGSSSAKERSQVLVGPALEAADARAEVDLGQDGQSSLVAPADATVLAVSRGTGWPRAILATSQEGEQQQLHVLVADGARSPYRLFASLPMAAGATIPALGDPAQGVAVTDPEDVTSSDLSAVSGWAKAVAYPAPSKEVADVSLDDAFSTALQDNATTQDTRLGDLATYTVSHTPAADGIVFTLADGGTLTIATATRKDTITATDEAKELTLPSDLAELVGEETVTDRVTVTHLETLALVTPKDGDTRLVGASEQITGAKGS